MIRIESLDDIMAIRESIDIECKLAQGRDEQVCRFEYLTTQVLGELLKRKEKTLRQNYLQPMVDSGKLIMAFPLTPTHPQQAYTTTDEPSAPPHRERG